MAEPSLSTATDAADLLEPVEPPSTGGDIERWLQRHASRREEAEPSLVAAYETAVAGFARSQLQTLRADHLSSHRTGGVVATDADEAGAERIKAAQQLMLSWGSSHDRPTPVDVLEAHAKLLVGGGAVRSGAVRTGGTRSSGSMAVSKGR